MSTSHQASLSGHFSNTSSLHVSLSCFDNSPNISYFFIIIFVLVIFEVTTAKNMTHWRLRRWLASFSNEIFLNYVLFKDTVLLYTEEITEWCKHNFYGYWETKKFMWLILLYWSGIKPTTSLSSVAQSCPTLCDPMDCTTPGFPVHHQLPKLAQTHVHQVGDAIQPSHPLSSPSPSALNLSQHQGIFQWVSSSHQVAEVLELQLQHQSFQWIFRTDFL